MKRELNGIERQEVGFFVSGRVALAFFLGDLFSISFVFVTV